MLYCNQTSFGRQSAKDTLEYRYPEVVVTAPRMILPLKEIPYATSVVSSEVMQSLPRAIAMDEPMKLVPGVKVDNQANGSRVHLSIRGQGILTERGIRGIKVLLDGIPINAAQHVKGFFNNLDRPDIVFPAVTARVQHS